MKKITIFYFTGTGNTLFLSKLLKEEFNSKGIECNLIDISSIDNKDITLSEDTVYGFVFPVYAFGPPRIYFNFLKNLPEVKEKSIKAFVISNAGSQEGTANNIVRNKLLKKGFDLIGNCLLYMPHGFILLKERFSKEKEEQLLFESKKSIPIFVNNLIEGNITSYKKINPFFLLIFRISYWGFRVMGVRMLPQHFKIDTNCNSCGYCAKICPMKNISMVNDKPKWGNKCEVCLRCLNYCPKKSIQLLGTKNRSRYNIMPLK